MGALRRRVLAVVPALLVMAVLAGSCSLLGFGESYPQPLPTRAGYSGSNGAFLYVRAVNPPNASGEVYIEGTLKFTRIDGPTALTWQVNAWTGEDGPIGIETGSYSIAFWERPCDGNCDYLDPEVSRCSADFEARPGDEVIVEARFPMHQPCSAAVTLH